MMVSGLRYLSPGAQQQQREKQLELDAMLVAKRAAKEHLVRLTPPAVDGAGPGSVAPVPPAGAAAGVPGALLPPALPDMAAIGGAAALADPALDPSIPPPVPPAPAPAGPPMPRFATGGVAGARPGLLPGVIPAEQIIEALGRKIRGEDVRPEEYVTAPPPPAGMRESAPTPEEPPAAPRPPQRFLVYLEGLTPATVKGSEWEADLLEAHDAGADPGHLWQVVREAVAEGDADLPDAWRRLVSGRGRGAPRQETAAASRRVGRMTPPRVE
jgi:hypothetical protein